MKIDLDEFKKHMKYIKKINSSNIEDIELIKDGKQIHIDEKFRSDWKYVGLSNKDFVNELIVKLSKKKTR
jgi:hypothetical protein